MKSRYKKWLAAALAAAVTLTAGTAGFYTYAQAVGNIPSPEPTATAGASAPDAASTDSGRRSTAGKEETVYVLAGADGTVRKIIVSDWLKNPDGAAELEDYTDLSDVTNVKGNETYRLNPDNMRVWAADGHDIYYQGTIDKSLPVDVTIRYTLDGNPISAADLAGKSGRVTIRFDYTNNLKVTVPVRGEATEICVPFLMLTGTILDNDRFRNITVSGGKLINDGSRSVVMGFALPGLQESLQLDAAVLELPSYVEIEADVQDFALETTLTLAANDPFSRIDLDEAEDLDSLKEAVRELDDATKQLLDGSSALYTGLSTLLDRSGELIAGIDRLAAGTEQLGKGATALLDGAGTLQVGLGDVLTGLEQLTGNSQALNDGAASVFETLLAAADTQLAAAGQTLPKLTIANYREVLQGLLESLDPDAVHALAQQTALQNVTAAVKAQTETIRAGVEAAAGDRILEGVLAAAGKPMSAEQYTQAVAAGVVSPEEQTAIRAAVDAQVDAAVDTQIASLIEENMNSAAVKAQIKEAEQRAAGGQESIRTLLEQLDSYNDFYTGLQTYTAGVYAAQNGVGQLNGGARELTAGLRELAGGTRTLQDGAGALQNGSSALTGGIRELQNGAMQLNSGLREFREQGIDKLVEAVDGDLEELTARIRAVTEVSRQYKSFAGSSSGMDGSVKFLYRTDAIG